MLMPSNAGGASASIAWRGRRDRSAGARDLDARRRAAMPRPASAGGSSSRNRASRGAGVRQLLLGLQLVGEHARLVELAFDSSSRVRSVALELGQLRRRSRSFCCRVSSVPNCSSRRDAVRQTARAGSTRGSCTLPRACRGIARGEVSCSSTRIVEPSCSLSRSSRRCRSSSSAFSSFLSSDGCGTARPARSSSIVGSRPARR